MSRRKMIGLPYENVGKNPIAGWTQAWMQSESVQVAPQEHEITSYKIGASKNDLDDMDFGDMKLWQKKTHIQTKELGLNNLVNSG